jgi:hypothetical protein
MNITTGSFSKINITNNNLQAGTVGVFLEGITDGIYSNNNVKASSYTFYILSSPNSRVSNNIFKSSGGNSVYLGSNNAGSFFDKSNAVTGAYVGESGGGFTVEKYGEAFPTSGTWNIGDMVYNTSPVSSGYSGWVCTASGSPGTWKGFGLIE